MMQRSAGLLASFFVFGDLKVASAQTRELEVAAAATFELVLQRLIFPGVATGELEEPSEEVREQIKAMSKSLKPYNAPQIFANSQLTLHDHRAELKISRDTSVVLSEDSVEIVKQFLTNSYSEEADLDDVDYFLNGMIEHLSSPDAWLDD